jgi:hypothetical protein
MLEVNVKKEMNYLTKIDNEIVFKINDEIIYTFVFCFPWGWDWRNKNDESIARISDDIFQLKNDLKNEHGDFYFDPSLNYLINRKKRRGLKR